MGRGLLLPALAALSGLVLGLLPAPASAAEPVPAPPASVKERLYKFDALDIEGNVDKPRLLYFLNRVKAELGGTRAKKRSFIPELKASEDAKEL
jgi:hypothetical protein